MKITNKEYFEKQSESDGTETAVFELDCQFNVRNSYMRDMFYKEIEVVFSFDDGSGHEQPKKHQGVHVWAVRQIDKDLYFVRDNFHPIVLNWIEDHILDNITNKGDEDAY